MRRKGGWTVSKEYVSVLLIGNSQQNQEIKDMLSGEARDTSFILYRAGSLAEGLKVLSNESIDVVLLILALPDSQGASTMLMVRSQASGVPVVVIGGSSEAVVANNLWERAQDIAMRQEVAASLLVQALLYAINQQRALRQQKAYEFGFTPLMTKTPAN
jgi:DNA-binding response OmpR family regulator